MIPGVHEDENHRGRARYTLTETEHGYAWGTCAEADGLFGEPDRGTYELFGWVPRADVDGWVGHRVWLVPDDETLEPWLLEDAERLKRPLATDSLVLTGLDDYEGPPEGHRGRVRVHDGHRWLGSCREFTRVLPPGRSTPPLVLRGLAQGDELRAALAKGTRRALDLEQAALEIRDDRGERLTERLVWARVSAWRPSPHDADLIRPGARRRTPHARPRTRPARLGTVVHRAARHRGRLVRPRHPTPLGLARPGQGANRLSHDRRPAGRPRLRTRRPPHQCV